MLNPEQVVNLLLQLYRHNMKPKTIMPMVRGLGDVVAIVAQPIAGAIDAVAGTSLKNCGGCKKRRELLNQKFPMKKTLSAILSLLAVTASALDFTYSTNLFYAVPYVTNVYCGTNSADTNRDTYVTAWNKLNHNDTLLERRANATTNNIMIGGVGLTNGTVTAKRVETTNLWLTTPRWVDSLAQGLSLAGGTAAPERADLPGSGWITPAQGYRYGWDDYASFSIQSWHVLATTNASLPRFYYEPHIHICATTLAAGTNATFVMEWQSSIVNAGYTNYNIVTNTYGFVGTNRHGILSFGNITNDALAGHASVMFRGSIKRIQSSSNDVGQGLPANPDQKVFIDSLDFHIPIRVLGSSSQYTGE